MKIHNYDESEIRQTLDFFHKAETVEFLYACLSGKQNPIDRFTLHCDLSCTDACPIRKQCLQKRFIELSSLVNRKAKEISFEDSAAYLLSVLND